MKDMKENNMTVLKASEKRKPYAYGVGGIMNILHCDKATALRYVESGILAPAIRMIRTVMVVDVARALQLASGHSV